MAFLHAVATLLVLATAGPGWLGILLADSERPTIAEVLPDSPAEHAGLQPGDVIVAVDGAEIRGSRGLVEALGGRTAGTRLRLQVLRDGAQREFDVTLGIRPEPGDTASGGERRTGRDPAPAAETGSLPPGFTTSYEAARAEAARRGQPMLVVFGAPESAAGRALSRALAAPALAPHLQRFSRVWLDIAVAPELAAELGVTQPPRLLVLDASGAELASFSGVLPPEALAARLEQLPRRASLEGLAAEVAALRREVAELRQQLRELSERRR